MWQQNQHHELEMLRQQAIFNEDQPIVDQGKKRLLCLQASIERKLNHFLNSNRFEKQNSDINLNDIQKDNIQLSYYYFRTICFTISRILILFLSSC